MNGNNGKEEKNETEKESTVLSGGTESIRRKFKHTHNKLAFNNGFQQNSRENMNIFRRNKKKQTETKS